MAKQVFEVKRHTLDRISIGMTYGFDGRQGRVVAKFDDKQPRLHVPLYASAACWGRGVPMVEVEWR